jgi:hypothetical protein
LCKQVVVLVKETPSLLVQAVLVDSVKMLHWQ